MSNDTNRVVEKLSDDIKKYIELQINYYRIGTLEKVASTTAFSIMAIIVSVLLFFTFIFANIFIAIILSYWLNSWTIGFGVFAGSYVFVTLILIIFWKKIQNYIYKRFTNVILESLDEDDN